MAVKTKFSKEDFSKILSNYDLGKYESFKTFAHGEAQTTLLLITPKGKFVLKYYENRQKNHVLFEVRLFNYLRSKKYPVPPIIKTSSGKYFGKYKGKPYIIIGYIEGKHGKNPNDFFDLKELEEVVKLVAKLHNLMRLYNPRYFKDRQEFNAEYCLREYKKRSRETEKNERESWLKSELMKLEFPKSLPKVLCHADLNYSNFLFQKGKVVNVLDFDASFYSYLIYDIANLIYWWAWPPQKGFQEKEAKKVVSIYSKYHKLGASEKKHIYDALKLTILLGISWSEEGDFEGEKKKIEFLNLIGREKFYNKMFN